MCIIFAVGKYNSTNMRYDKEKIYEQAVKAVKENDLYFADDIMAYLPCDRSTFYRLIPQGSDLSDNLKVLLDDNKIRTKIGIRAKLFQSGKAGELLALYRLICTPEERRMLNQNYIEITGKDGKSLPKELADSMEMTREQALRILGDG